MFFYLNVDEYKEDFVKKLYKTVIIKSLTNFIFLKFSLI